jgi:hypothetical protein
MMIMSGAFINTPSNTTCFGMEKIMKTIKKNSVFRVFVFSQQFISMLAFLKANAQEHDECRGLKKKA